MHDLATIQRMNAEAVENYKKRLRDTEDVLSDMLYEYEELDGDVTEFITKYAKKLTR